VCARACVCKHVHVYVPGRPHLKEGAVPGCPRHVNLQHAQHAGIVVLGGSLSSMWGWGSMLSWPAADLTPYTHAAYGVGVSCRQGLLQTLHTCRMWGWGSITPGPTADLTLMQHMGMGFHTVRACCRPDTCSMWVWASIPSGPAADLTHAECGGEVPYRQGQLQTIHTCLGTISTSCRRRAKPLGPAAAIYAQLADTRKLRPYA